MEKRISIVHICKVYRPVKGGVQIAVERLAEKPDAQYISKVLTTSTSGSGVERTCSGYVLRCKAWLEAFSMPIAPRMVCVISRLVSDRSVLVLHAPFPLADLIVAVHPFAIKNLILFWHSDVVSQKIIGCILSPLAHFTLRRAKVIFVSNPTLIEKSRFLRNYQGKCVVLPIGFQPQKDFYENTSDEGYYLCVGRHVRYKGIGVFIRAAEKAQVKAVVVGDGPLFSEHSEYVKKQGLLNQISFKRDLSDYEIQKEMSRCRALVLPSVLESEAFGMVQVEAMAFGKPVINTELDTGVPWVARNGIEAITVKPGNDEEMCQAICSLDNDEGMRKELGKNGFKRWQSEFTLDLMQRRFHKVIADFVRTMPN